MDGGDVWMIQGREDFGFPLEPGEPIRVVASDGGRILIATWRFSFVSVARNTCPIPPSPIWAVIDAETSAGSERQR
jgi:hypothetical protein